MARPSKEFILQEIRRCAEANGGAPLGKRRFEEATNVAESDWLGVYWARWNDAVAEAGLSPNTWQGRDHDDAALVRMLADATRAFGRFPTTPQLRIHRLSNAEVPNDKVFRNRLGSTADMVEHTLTFARSNSDYSDVAAILAATPSRASRTQTPPASEVAVDGVVTGVVYLIRMGEFYKIGKSNDVGRRMYELGVQLPEKHDVIHAIETDDPAGIEAYWHRRFAAQRSNGEWFRLSPGDVAAFRRRAKFM